jgi:hypothetical protein
LSKRVQAELGWWRGKGADRKFAEDLRAIVVRKVVQALPEEVDGL